ncbi:VTT domain-containing protein [Hydrogenophaga sp. 5NK40-0174]|uniref:TVP38/TMEM64 family protein n=1 Tax=Hydrogenophaga sp. 5NK40-0174 TaxID=3127649 RepID=UPI00310AD43B
MKSGAKLILKPFLLSVVLAVGFAALHFGWFGDVTEEALLRSLFAQHWMVAWPVFVSGSIIYTALGGPRQVLAFSCGYLLGGFAGGVVSALLTGAGAWVAIMVVRQVGMDWVMRKHGEKVERVREVLAEDTWLWVCIVRLMPVGSNLATNVAAALAGLRTSSVLLGSLLGYLPQSLLFAYAGAGVALHDSSQIYISLALLVGSSALALYLYHNGFKQRMGALRRPRADV